MRKARLVFTLDCNKECPGCCMRNWIYDPPKEISVVDLAISYDEIYITGGEPMLYPDALYRFIKKIKGLTKAKIFLYTARPYPAIEFVNILFLLDGCTITIHDPIDLIRFKKERYNKIKTVKSMRLNTFIKITERMEGWDIRHVKWIKDCPLPEGEELVRIGGINDQP